MLLHNIHLGVASVRYTGWGSRLYVIEDLFSMPRFSQGTQKSMLVQAMTSAGMLSSSTVFLDISFCPRILYVLTQYLKLKNAASCVHHVHTYHSILKLKNAAMLCCVHHVHTYQITEIFHSVSQSYRVIFLSHAAIWTAKRVLVALMDRASRQFGISASELGDDRALFSNSCVAADQGHV